MPAAVFKSASQCQGAVSTRPTGLISRRGKSRLTEFTVHIQPHSPTSRSHHNLPLLCEPLEKQRANDNDRYLLTAHPGNS